MSAVARLGRVNQKARAIPRIGLYDLASVAVFVAILSVAVIPRFDPDFWWHLYTGRHILAAGVPARDFLSYTAAGHTWIDHEWLAEIGLYALVQFGGFKVVLAIFGLIVTGAFLAGFCLMKLRGVHPSLGLVLTLVAALATAATWGPRIQMISLLFAGIFCILLERHRTTGATRWLAMIVAGMFLWSNLHGGFAIGLILIAIYLVGGILDRMKAGMSRGQAFRRQRPLLVTLVAAFATTFLNPETYHTALYPLRFVTPNVFTNTIQESQSPNFHLFQSLPFELLLIGLLVGALVSRRRISWIDILLCAVFTHLALQQVRNVDLWCIIVVPIVGMYATEWLGSLSRRVADLNRPVPVRIPALVNWALLAAIVVAGISFLGRIESPANVLAAARSAFPVSAVSYLKAHPPKGRGFNSYTYGGYLIWATNDRFPVFIDSRADTVYADSVLQDYLAIYDAKPAWQQDIRKYRIRWVFVESSAPIAAVLQQTDGWRKAFSDKQAVIYERP